MLTGRAVKVSLVDDPSFGGPRRVVTIGLFEFATAAILCLAAAIRLWNIGAIPLELHPDEMAGLLGVRDMLTGHTPPSVFIDYRVVYLPLYGFFEVLSTALLDTTITAIRLPAALLGVATAFATGLLAYQIVRSRLVFLAACFIMAILPWDVSISRVGWEPAATLPFLLFGIYFLRRGLYAPSGRDIRIGCALLAVGAYSYRAELFNAIALTLALLAIEFPRAWRAKREIFIGLLIAGAILIPLGLSAMQHPQYFSSGPAQTTFGSGINADSLRVFRDLYLMHLSLSALFFTGDSNLQHGPAIGVLYPWMLPFILIGMFAPWRPLAARARVFLLCWVALFPVGGSVTDDGLPHFIRTLTGAPIACILAAIGLAIVWDFFQGSARLRAFAKPLFALIALAMMFGFATFVHTYFVSYPEESAKIFHYGDRDIFAFVHANDAGYDRICFTALDAWNYSADMEYYMHSDPIQTIEGLSDPACRKPRTLLGVASPSEAPAGARLIGTVQRRDGTIRIYFMQT